MLRSVGLLAAGLIVMSLLAACGSESSQSSEPLDKPSATVPPQPEGAHGVTANITNWDEYYDDPAALVIKDFAEEYSGSFKEREIKEGLKETLSEKAFDDVKKRLDRLWDDGTYPADEWKFRIDSVENDGDKTKVETCIKIRTYIQRKKNGDLVNPAFDVDEWWEQTYTLSTEGDKPVLSKTPKVRDDKCPAKPKDDK